jgi:hypothetical protein
MGRIRNRHFLVDFQWDEFKGDENRPNRGTPRNNSCIRY